MTAIWIAILVGTSLAAGAIGGVITVLLDRRRAKKNVARVLHAMDERRKDARPVS